MDFYRAQSLRFYRPRISAIPIIRDSIKDSFATRKKILSPAHYFVLVLFNSALRFISLFIIAVVTEVTTGKNKLQKRLSRV